MNRRIPQNKINPWVFRFLLLAVLAIGAPFFLKQDTRKEGIRVLIDRPPGTLDARHLADGMARRILPLLTEVGYRLQEPYSLESFTLLPPSEKLEKLHFEVVRDDLTRGILFDRGEADVLFDSLSLSKTRHFRDLGSRMIDRPGSHLSYLGFNLKHPWLSRRAVRLALAQALPLETWMTSKYRDFTLPFRLPFQEAPHEARAALDSLGLTPNPAGDRLTLRYLTTPTREGQELAHLVREALRKIGIRVIIIPLEPSLFFSRLNQGDFELFGSRILRSSLEDPVGEYFKTGSRKNYFHYSNSTLDQEVADHPETPLHRLLPFLLNDLPIIPLFTWNHDLLLSSRVQWAGSPPRFEEDSFRFLSSLHLK